MTTFCWPTPVFLHETFPWLSCCFVFAFVSSTSCCLWIFMSVSQTANSSCAMLQIEPCRRFTNLVFSHAREVANSEYEAILNWGTLDFVGPDLRQGCWGEERC